jgi:hypothetical protein
MPPEARLKKQRPPFNGLEIENFTDDESNCDFCKSCISREMRVLSPAKISDRNLKVGKLDSSLTSHQMT